MQIPSHLWLPQPSLLQEYSTRVDHGRERLSESRIAIVGLARNCAGPLQHNLRRAESLATNAASCVVHIEANDCEDATLDVLHQWHHTHACVSYRYQTLSRQSYGTEFAGRRTIAMAEYRAACQEWVREHAADSQLVLVIDWDAWGGWNHDGLLHGISWLLAMPDAYGMASVSLAQSPTLMMNNQQEAAIVPAWTHYDAWALRGIGQADCYLDDYSTGFGGWKHGWLPPVGSCPVLVSSAFGGLCVYRTEAYLAGTYDGADCEHVTFHRSIAAATGEHLYLCPGMRTIMSWMEAANGNGVHGV